MVNSTLNYQSTTDFRVGHELYIGGHNSRLCNLDDGCQVVTITQVWMHEDYEDIYGGRIPNEDITMVK